MTNNTNFLGIKLYKQGKKEPYMSDEMREHFIHILVSWRQSLMVEAEETVRSLKEPHHFPDPIDRASEEEERTVELKTSDRKRKLIRKIDKTIDKVRDEAFGYCDSCGVEIGIRRLEARPTATECIDCKSFDEIKEKTDMA